MSLWGNSDNLGASIGPASGTVVGSAGSEFWTVEATGINTVPTGTTLIFSSGSGAVGDAGFGVLESHLSANLGKLNIRSAVPGGPWDIVYSQQPIQFAHDPGYNGWSSSVPGSVTESGAAVTENADFAEIGRTQMPTAINATTFDAVSGTVWEEGVGWVGVTTYMALNPDTGTLELRIKTETLVAMSGGPGPGIETGNRPYPENYGG